MSSQPRKNVFAPYYHLIVGGKEASIGNIHASGELRPISITFDSPAGLGGNRLTVELADAKSVKLDPGTEVRLRLGYFDDTYTNVYNSVPTFYGDSTVGYDSWSFTVEPEQNTGTFTAKDLLGTRHLKAPTEVEPFPPPGMGGELTLEFLLKHVYIDKLGFAGIRHNLPPKLVVPSLVFTPEQSYHDTAAQLLGNYDPIWLERATTPTQHELVLYTTSRQITAAAVATISSRNYTSYRRERTLRPIVNQIYLTYHTSGGVGGEAPGSEPGAQPGDRIFYSSGLNPAPFDPRTLANGGSIRLETRTNREFAYEVRQDGILNFKKGSMIETTSELIVWYDENEEGDMEQVREEEIGSKVTQWAVDGPFIKERVSTTETSNFYLAGTDLQVSIGHVANTFGLVALPGYTRPFQFGIGNIYMPDGMDNRSWQHLSTEREVIAMERLYGDGENDYRKVHSIRTVEGLILKPDNIALVTANLNDTVEQSDSTPQFVERGLMSQRTELVRQAGSNQLKVTIVEYDVLAGTIKFSETRDTFGKNKTNTNDREPVRELIQDFVSINTYGARAATTIDATWLGNTTMNSSRPNQARNWAYKQAQAAFKNSGQPTKRATVTVPKLMLHLKKGDVIKVGGRLGTDTDDMKLYLVEGISIRLSNLLFDATSRKGPEVSTTLTLSELP